MAVPTTPVRRFDPGSDLSPLDPIPQEGPKPALELRWHVHRTQASRQIAGFPIGFEVGPAGLTIGQMRLEGGEEAVSEDSLEIVSEEADGLLTGEPPVGFHTD